MVPPWAPDPSGPDQDGQPDGGDGQADDNGAPPQQAARPQPAVPIAPSGRFGSARRDLGSFARTGSTADMRTGVGHYVSKGLGGARTATRRFGGTARTAGSLYGALSMLSSGQSGPPGSPLDRAILQGRSAETIMDAVVEAVRPVDGTQDTEASRYAISEALSEVLDRYPEADLLNLSEEERLIAIESYVGLDVFNRFDLDVGTHLRENAPSTDSVLSRLREVKDYIRETVSEAFRGARTAAHSLDSARIGEIARATLQESFEVFEGYLS